MRSICRSTSDWVRRERLTNIALMLLRRRASSPASRMASRWTSSKARATSPISSRETTPMEGTSICGAWSPDSRSTRTVSGSRVSATSSASVRSLRSGRTSVPATQAVMSRIRTSRTRIEAPEIMALRCSALSISWLRETTADARRRSTVRMPSTIEVEAEYQLLASRASPCRSAPAACSRA